MRPCTTGPGRAAAAAVIGLCLTSGCAAQETQAAPGASSSASAARPPVQPLTTARLKALAFQPGEVPEVHEPLTVQEPEPEDSGRSFPPPSDPACRPLPDVRNGKGSAAHVFQHFNWKKNLMGGSSTLASYAEGEAARVFAELERALATCRSYEGEGWGGPYTVRVRTETAPRVGDEAVAYRETDPSGPEDDRHN